MVLLAATLCVQLLLPVSIAKAGVGVVPGTGSGAQDVNVVGWDPLVLARNATAVDLPRKLHIILNGIARGVAQAASTLFLRSIADWVRGGFQGKPYFVTNPEYFFKNLAYQAILSHQVQAAATQLCYPFSIGVGPGLSLPGVGGYPELKCTLSDPGRAAAFFDDFNEGGWKMWNEILEPQNNFYGQIALLREQANLKVANRQSYGNSEYLAGQGFLGIKQCAVNVAFSAAVNGRNFNVNQCSEYANVTPGSLVARKLGAGLSEQEFARWINVHEITDLIGALFNGVINRLIGTRFFCLACAGGALPSQTIQVGGNAWQCQSSSPTQFGTCYASQSACTADCGGTGFSCKQCPTKACARSFNCNLLYACSTTKACYVNDGSNPNGPLDTCQKACTGGQCNPVNQCPATGGEGGGKTAGAFCAADAECLPTLRCNTNTGTGGGCVCATGGRPGTCGQASPIAACFKFGCPSGQFACPTKTINGCYSTQVFCNSQCGGTSCDGPCPAPPTCASAGCSGGEMLCTAGQNGTCMAPVSCVSGTGGNCAGQCVQC